MLSVLAVPQMLIYRYFHGLNFTSGESVLSVVSFGNMGFSTNTCGMNFIDWSIGDQTVDVKLQCQGTARIRKVIDSGVVNIRQDGEERTFREFNRCFYDKEEKFDESHVMHGFDSEYVQKQTIAQCNGMQQCEVSLDFRKFGENAVGSYDVFVFLQVGCEQDSEMLFLKNVLGLCSSVIGLYICLVYRNTITVL